MPAPSEPVGQVATIAEPERSTTFVVRIPATGSRIRIARLAGSWPVAATR